MASSSRRRVSLRSLDALHKAKPIPARPGSEDVDSTNEATTSMIDLDSPTVELTDDQLTLHIHALQTQLRAFAAHFVSVRSSRIEKAFDGFLVERNEELVRCIGFMSASSSRGEEGWKNFLAEQATRQAVVVGVLGMKLKECVFDELFFGAGERVAEKLQMMERRQGECDAFFRARNRAIVLAAQESTDDISTFATECDNLVASLVDLLLPFWKMARSRSEWETHKMESQLSEIVSHAALLSRAMRRQPEAVYRWHTPFKDDLLAFSTMDCLNLRAMGEEQIRLSQQNESNKGAEEAIIQIVTFPSLVVYRSGGPKGSGSSQEGYRSRLLTKALVYARWGRQHLLTKEAGTAPHLNAKRDGLVQEKYGVDYEGHVQLYDLWWDKVKGGKVRS